MGLITGLFKKAMEYKTGKFSLNEAQQNLRIGITSLIREHVERGMTMEELVQVVDGLEFTLNDHRYKERTDDEQWDDARFRLKEQDE